MEDVLQRGHVLALSRVPDPHQRLVQVLLDRFFHEDVIGIAGYRPGWRRFDSLLVRVLSFVQLRGRAGFFTFAEIKKLN